MHIRGIHLLVLFLISFLEINAQYVQMTFHHLTEADGLTPAKEYKLSRDSKGLIWIGTEGGLLCFDSYKIKKYQHQPTQVNSLSEDVITSQCFEDHQGNLWFTSTGLVNCYRRGSDDFMAFAHPQRLKDYRGFYFDQQNRLWLQIGSGKEGALYFFDTKTSTFEQSVPLEGRRCTVVKNNHKIVEQLISTALPKKPGLIWTDLKNGIKKEVEFLFRPDGTKRFHSSPTKEVLMDSDSIIWTGLYNGLGKYQLGTDQGFAITKRNKTIDPDIGWIGDIIRFDENRLMVAASSGLVIFDIPSQTFVQQFRNNPTAPYNLSLKNLNTVFLDSSKTVWVAGPQQEIAFANFSKNRFTQLSKTTGSYISALAEDPFGNIWCSTLDSGTLVYNQEQQLLFQTSKLKNPTHPKGYSDLTPLDFFISSNQNQWWGNIGNTYLIWNPSSKEFEFNLSYFFGVGGEVSNRINYNYQQATGKHLITKGSVIYELQFSEEKVDTLPWYNLQYLQLQTINILFEDQQQQIYIGDNQGRLVVLKENNGQVKKLADLKNLGIIYAFKQDPNRNTIWVANSKGLGKIDPVSFAFTLLEEVNDRIPNEPIYNIALDRLEQLWLPGNNGLIRYHPDTKAFHRFGTADGLLSPVFNKNTCLTASQSGEIWLGSKNGLNVFKPEEIKLLDFKPNVQLSRFLVNDEEYEIEGNLNEQKKMTFDYEQNTLSFQFVALDYSDPSANRFTCQMEGYDDTPIDNGNRNFIRYGNLPAGTYTFKVWATNSDGVLYEKPLELGIKIIPPFYQTWWFYLLCTIAISSIIYGIFKYRLKQALKVERMRVKISSDLHDDVGGLLSGLAMQTEILELTAKDDVKPKLKRIAALSRSAMSRMRDTVWAIDARKDKLENLLDRMREHAEETLTPKHFHYDISIENIDLKTNLPTDIRQNIYLIYKEAITNIAKHSNGDNVAVDLKKSTGNFEMRIRDNGKVEEKNYKTTGLGQSNMKMRAKQIGGSLQTIRNDGFQIILRMKWKI